MILQHIYDIATVCAAHRIKTAIISPGSRSAALTLAFVRHPEIETKIIPDERSAAFIAMGMAQQQGKPVALICTSGSAAYNYAPAIAEAYYQEIPLLILTADRPPEWTNQYDGQTIQQSNIYGKHVLASYDFPVEVAHEDIKWQCNRIVNEAIGTSIQHQGPVHINIPIREPFYPNADEIVSFPKVRIIHNTPVHAAVDHMDWVDLGKKWQKHQNIAIVIGQMPASKSLHTALYRFAEKTGVPIIADVIANQHDLSKVIHNQDAFLSPQLNTIHQDLKPSLLITVGKSLISKNLKTYLRNNPPQAHWHISTSEKLNDSLQHLTRLIKVEPAIFFSEFTRYVAGKSNFAYLNHWQKANNTVETVKAEFLKMRKFSEFQAFNEVIQSVPEKAKLHFANSMAIRYANVIGAPKNRQLEIYGNRGTSGIDGSNSTAVGAALSQKSPVVLFTGDMAFFYDRNAFWHNYNLKNLRVIVFNNHGGGIFRMIDGPKRQPELEEYFETKQKLNAENTANDFGFEYQSCSNLKDLKECLESFFSASKQAKILEIQTNSERNTEMYGEFKRSILDAFNAS
ncbi:2-succinyl-5-enolpyruvyl-6-hydroxy-3-cyclohexene-1-carboxylic-acid synthase [Roseivirga echinicomitans]